MQRADERSRPVLVPAEAGHHAIGRAGVLDLGHRRACPAAYGSLARLPMTPSSPAPSKTSNQCCAMAGSVVDGVSRTDAGGSASDPLQARASLGEGAARRSSSPSARQSKATNEAGRLGGQHLHPRRRGVDAEQEGVEVEPAVGPRDDHLAVEHEARVRAADRAQRLLELREVSIERLQVPGLDVDLAAVAEDERAKAVPLRLVDPALAVRDRGGRLGQHRLDGRLDRVRHVPMIRAWHRAYSARLERQPSHEWEDLVGISIQFLGAAGCVTGSQFLVSVGDRRVLVDCGMFQGSPQEVERNQMPFAFEPATLDALLLTHAHLDHCGRIPALTKAGFRGPIHATRATVDLTDIVLRDSAKLQVEFTNRWNKRQARKAERGARQAEQADAETQSEAAAQETDDPSLPERLRHAPPEGKTVLREPLYDEHDVERAVEQMRGCDYGDEVHVTDGVTAVFHDAGHILGSAIVELRVTDGGEVRHHRLLRRSRSRRHPDPARPDADLARRVRRGRVDLRQPGARAARRRDRGAGGRRRRGRRPMTASCSSRPSRSAAPRS